MVSKFIKRGTNKENVWEHGNIGQFWKGSRTPPGRPSASTENSIIFNRLTRWGGRVGHQSASCRTK